LHKQGRLDYLFVDHIGLMSTGDTYKDRNANDRVSAITGSLKNLANELRIPVIPLSQLSRALETRGGSKRPQLSDLRDSGAIEQDADTVTFIYRPEYYGIEEDEQGQSTVGIAELIVAKYRDGEPGTGICGFHPVRGFVFSENEMRGTEQAKITAMKGQRDAQFPDNEPEWVQGNNAAQQQPRSDNDIPF
jgi:replicative DNA helicase